MEEHVDPNNYHSSLISRQLSVCTNAKARGSGEEQNLPHVLKWELPSMNTASHTMTPVTEGLADRGDQGQQQGEKGHNSLITLPQRSQTA